MTNNHSDTIVTQSVSTTQAQTPVKAVNLSISVEKLAALFQAGHLCAADLNCLDHESKQQIWQLCLWSCNKRVHCEHVSSLHPDAITIDVK